MERKFHLFALFKESWLTDGGRFWPFANHQSAQEQCRLGSPRLRERKRGKTTCYLYDTGGKPCKEIPLGTDYGPDRKDLGNAIHWLKGINPL